MKLLAFIACGLVLLVGVLMCLKTASRLPDEAPFLWDENNYHCLAANYAMGHGMKTGAIEPLENYRYMHNDPAAAEELIASSARGGDPTLVRTRGYPFFLSLIYRVAGVHPRAGRLAQLVLIILVGAGLPWLGFYLWGGTGILPGAWAGVYYIGQYSVREHDLMAEPLFAFVLFLWTCLFVYWQRSRKWWQVFGLGVLAGYAVLVKGTGIFLFPVTAVVLAWQWWRSRPNTAALSALAIFVIGYGVVVIPYSVMVSRIAGRFVMFSTQGLDAFQGGNSLIADGGYQSNWREQFGEFHLMPAARMPRLLVQKIDQGFSWSTAVRLAVAGIGLWLTRELRRRWGERWKWPVTLGGCAFVVACFNPLAALSHGVLVQHEPIALVIALGIGALIALHRLRVPGLERVPLPFLILTASLLLTTVVMFGLRRYVCVIDWVFLLSAAYLIGGAWWPKHYGLVERTARQRVS